MQGFWNGFEKRAVAKEEKKRGLLWDSKRGLATLAAIPGALTR